MVFRDTGKGVDAHHLPYLREKFYQEDTARTISGDHGIGIGLSLVDKIAKLHGGYLDMSSKAGEFFEIRIILPEKSETQSASRIFHPQDLISKKAQV